ncbi:MAG: carboxypeptidase regulatory-like domain-containing protein [Acidobacteriota bacterium]
MAGQVTDQSGAAVPNAMVTLTNPSLGLKYTAKSDATGFYRFTNLPPGQGYIATFSATGFAQLQVKSIYLTVNTVRTQNGSLSVGSQVSTVEVTASNAVVTIDTTDALVGNNIDVQQLQSLPVQQRSDPLALFALQPGATDTGAVTGARVDQNNVTVDGLDVNDFATGGASQGNAGSGISTTLGTIVGHAPVDSVEEFKGDVAGNDATSGLAAGGQFALVTKSGTNHFHGDLNEYHRDTSLVANSWFSNNAAPIVPRQHFIHNQFGGALGGPILHDKLFFFFDLNESRIVAGSVENRVVPSPSLRAGSIAYCTDAACDTTNTLTMAQVSSYDPAGLGVDQNWLQYIDKRFPTPNLNSGGDGLNSLGYAFNAPADDNLVNYVTRVDYTLNDSMKMFAKFTITRENSINQPNQFPGDPITSPFIDRSYDFVVGHTWVLGPNKTNNLYIGEVVQKVGFPINYNPTGTTAFTFGDGADQALTSNPYIWPSSQARRVPIEQLGDDFTMIKGKHTVQFGGRIEDILAHSTNVGDYNTTEIGLGGQILSLCGPSVGACGANNPSLRPSDLSLANKFTWDEPFAFLLGRIASISSDYNYNAQGNVLQQLTGDQRFYRYYQTQYYFSDSWKLLPSLTINYGINYQWFSVPYETRGLESVEPFTFNQYFGARVQQSTLGETGPGAVPLISYLLGGKANGASAPPLYKPEYRNIAPRVGFVWNPGFDKKMVINGSAGIVYDRTVINAIQFIQDGYSYLFQQTKGNSYGIPHDPYDSIKNDARLDANNQISTVTLTPPATPKPPYQPFTGAYCAAGIAAGTYSYSPCGLQNGLAFNATIDPSLQTPYNMMFNFGVQREMPWHMVLKVNYVARLSRKLLAQEDANQVLEFPDPQSGELMSQAFASITQQTRQGVAPQNLTVQPWFENVIIPGLGQQLGYSSNTAFIASAVSGLVYNGDFGDFVEALSTIVPPNVGSAAQFSENTFYDNAGFSNYDGLLFTLQKNMSNGLHFDFNYTWSHSIDNVSFFANSAGDTGIGGIGLVCDAIRPRECRASSDFDVRNYITTDATYQLPFGRGRTFLASDPRWVDELIGSWDISGIGEWHGGFPWSGASNAFVASYSNDAPPIFVGNNRAAIKTGVHKLAGGGVSEFKDASLASQQFEGPVGFQIGPRNSFRGPSFFNADLGLAKNFPVYGEGVNLKFRADAFNALNHPNFQNPAENAFNGYDAQDYQQGAGFGAINFPVVPSGNENNGARVLQLSLRLEF